jgi:H+/Cl- antiporter ClcA/PII-like signaling protein
MPLRFPFHFQRREQSALAWALIKWSLLGSWVGLISGSASAIFLLSLAWATRYRELHPILLWGLPLAGAAIGLVYARYGKSVEAGNNLLLETVHNPRETIPFRMAPLVLICTVLTHLFGGSAGREGTAVQMGGTLANLAKGPLRLSSHDHRVLIMSGISGGFGSVFGTPVAGTIFGLEVLTVGRMSYEALIPCFVASVTGDLVCRAWGVTHHAYSVAIIPQLTPRTWALIVVAGVLFALASLLFGELTHAIGHIGKARIKRPWLRPLVGGSLIIGLTYVVGTRAYLGLSLPLIERSFTPEGVFWGAFALKILFTAITLGMGFKGGEVTPLFCIGATLGAAFARLTGQPTAFFAALGFVAVFAGAANTPLSCIVMGIELFGSGMTVPLTAVCITSYILSGHRGIYLSQRVHTPKASSVLIPHGALLKEARAGSMEIVAGRLARRRSGRAHSRLKESIPGEQTNMAAKKGLTSQSRGMLRILLRAGDQTGSGNWKDRLFGKPDYARIIKAAREYGLPHGLVKQCTSGFIDDGHIHHTHIEGDNGRLPVYVELHGTREALEGFCEQAHELLNGRTLIYKEVEHWMWQDDHLVEEAIEGDDVPEDETLMEF